MLVICRLNSPLPCPEARLDKTVREEGASMHAIADWLKELGMSEYADRFAENRIDLSVLPDLTDQHLKDLGIALGDRLKMLRAIRELSSAVLASPQPALTEPKPQDTAERRQVTVVFSDLVGSTAPGLGTLCAAGLWAL
jgi:SAM domain (Sterile alpha motif)